MEDQTENSEKLEPCAFCRRQPVKFVNVEGWRFACTDLLCPGQSAPVSIQLWYKKQERFLKQRRRDFEAGILRAYSENISDTWLCEHQDLTCSELRDKIWNKYLGDNEFY